MSLKSYDCIIIGGGVGGLAAGAYLARAGCSTLVLEKNRQVGGMAGTFSMNGYTFDVGGTPQHDQLAMLSELGVDGMVDFIPMTDPAIGMYFPDYTVFGPRPLEAFVAQLEGFCSPGERAECAAILSTFERLDMNRYVQLNQSMNESKLKFLGSLVKSNPLELLKVFGLMTSPLDAWLRKRSASTHVLEIISFISALTLLYPCARMPALLGVLIMSGFTGKLGGRWHLIRGGNVNFSLALAHAITHNGGEILTDTAVRQIRVTDGCAHGVVLEDGREIAARHIISDVGIRETVRNLVGAQRFPEGYLKKITALRPSPSLFKLCLGLKHKPDLPAVVNFKVSRLNEAAWWQTLEQGAIPERPPLMFWCKYLVDPGMAPAGRYDIDILVAAPYRHRDGAWEQVKQKERDKVIAVMDELIPGIEHQIDFEWMFTPPELEAYSGQAGGGILPVEPAVDQLMKFPDMMLPVKNLYCVGATVKGGAGINGAAYTGKLCARRIAGA